MKGRHNLVAIAGSVALLTATACNGPSGDVAPPAPGRVAAESMAAEPRDEAIQMMCQRGRQAAEIVMSERSVESLGPYVEDIEQINLQTPAADSFMHLVPDLVSAWQGYVALRADAELTDGGQAAVAMLEKLLSECGS